MNNKKPPIGVIPHWLWVSTRIHDLLEAMERYANEGIPIKPEWVSELSMLIYSENEKLYAKTHLNSSYGQMCYQDTDSIKGGD